MASRCFKKAQVSRQHVPELRIGASVLPASPSNHPREQHDTSDSELDSGSGFRRPPRGEVLKMAHTGALPSTVEVSEQEIIEQLRHGDTSNFQRLYDMHKKRAYSLCLRMTGNQAIAEELTQEAFLLVFRRISTFRGDAAFSTWLHRLTSNCVLMHLRQQRSRLTEASYEEPGVNEEGPRQFGSPDRVLSVSDDRITLLRAIDQLPPGYRLVFLLHDVEGYEHNEIAEILGCSVGNTKSQLHKARLKLRRSLAGAPHGAATA